MRKLLTFIALVVAGFRLQAQVDLQNTGILHILGVTDTLYINGSFTNTIAPGALTNRGQLYVTQNLINGQLFPVPPQVLGTLHLNGNALQTISGTSPFKTFNLRTDNAAGFILSNDLSIAGLHTYNNGIITTSATPNYLIYELGSSHVGAADGAHVNGWVKKRGTTNFTFPVGNGTVIRSASIETLSGSLEFNAKYEAPTLNTTNVLLPLLSVDPNEYWIIDRITGSGSAQVHLNWDNGKVAFPQYVLSAIRVAYYAGGWNEIGGSATGNVNTTGDITSNAVGSFGAFTFGSNDFLLPLQFLGITAQRKTNYNFIEWRTASATNTDHFDIERSEDALHFKNIGSTVSYNSPSAISYTFKDVNLTEGTLWYRIRSVDKDGSSMLSDVVSVKDVQQANQSMYVLNNPARGTIYLFAPNSYKGRCDYYITSTTGQVMQKGNLTVNTGGNVFIKLNAGINPGVYILSIHNDKNRFRERVLVK